MGLLSDIGLICSGGPEGPSRPAGTAQAKLSQGAAAILVMFCHGMAVVQLTGASRGVVAHTPEQSKATQAVDASVLFLLCNLMCSQCIPVRMWYALAGHSSVRGGVQDSAASHGAAQHDTHPYREAGCHARGSGLHSKAA